MHNARPSMARYLLVIFLAVGLVIGYTISYEISGTVKNTQSYTTTSTVITTTQNLIQQTYVTTTIDSTTVTTSTVVAGQYLTMSQVLAKGLGSFVDISGCQSPCNSSSEVSYIFPIANMSYFYSQINVTASGVSAAVSSHANASIVLTLTNSNASKECFVYYLNNVKLPPTIYVWYYGSGTCP